MSQIPAPSYPPDAYMYDADDEAAVQGESDSGIDLDEETRLMELVADLDFSSCVFSWNSDLIIDNTATRYYYERMEAAPTELAARSFQVRWSTDTKAAMLVMLQQLWVPSHDKATNALYNKDIPLTSNALFRTLFFHLNLMGHGALFDKMFLPQAAALARCTAELAERHGLVAVKSGWTISSFKGLLGKEDRGEEEEEEEENDVMGTIMTKMMMGGAKAWLENVAVRDRLAKEAEVRAASMSASAAAERGLTTKRKRVWSWGDGNGQQRKRKWTQSY